MTATLDVILTGRALPLNVFTDFEPRSGILVREQVLPGALRWADDLPITMNHRDGAILGRLGDNAHLVETPAGIIISLKPRDDSLGRQLLAAVRTGKIAGMSPAFGPKDYTWRYHFGGARDRTITRALVTEWSVLVSPDRPSYPHTFLHELNQ